MKIMDLGSPELDSGLGPTIEIISSSLGDYLDKRQSARQHHRAEIARIQANYVEDMRRADRIFESRVGQAGKVRRQAFESNPDGEDGKIGLWADETYFDAVKEAEAIHCEHRREIEAAKTAAEKQALDEKEREYRAATAWFLGVVKREMESAIRDIFSSHAEG